MKSSFECKEEILNYLQENKPRLNIHFSQNVYLSTALTFALYQKRTP